MAWKLADLFVQITGDAKPLSSALVLVQQQLMGMSGIGGQLGSSIASGIAGPMLGLSATAATGVGLIAIAAAAATAALAKTAMMAGHLTEAINKSEQIFGSSNGKIIALADELATKFGIVKTTVLDTAASFGGMLEGSGVARDKAADMSSTLVRLAADAKSFYDVPMDVAIQKLTSGLSGQMEAVREWGINLSEANVAQKAMAMGLYKGKGEMDQATKTMVRYQLLVEGLKAAEGDLERTGGGLVQQWDKFTGSLINMATTIGTAVVPVFTALLRSANSVLDFVGPIIGEISGLIAEIGTPLISLAQAVGSTVLPVLGLMATELTRIMDIVGGIVSGFASWIGWATKLSGLASWFTGEDTSEKDKAEKVKAIDARIDKSKKEFDAETAAGKAMTTKTPKGFQGGLEEYARKVQESAFGTKDPERKTVAELKKIGTTLDEMKKAKSRGSATPEPAF